MKKKGFTLIELMIVLAVIAILAVVLIPKAGNFKNNAKNAGVNTNVNAVRAFLETKTATSFISAANNLDTAIENAFSASDEKIVNPLNSADTNDDVVTAVPANAGSEPGVYVTTNAGAPTLTDATWTANLPKLKGSVVVVIDTTNNKYILFGVDNAGTAVSNTTISK